MTPLNPTSIRAPFAAYSHGVAVPPGARWVVTSGQLGVAPDDHVPEDVEAQAELCFANIKAILAEAGMSLADVVRFTCYVTERSVFPIYGAVRARLVAGNAFASTLVIVMGFTRPEFKIEIEATAARVDDGSFSRLSGEGQGRSGLPMPALDVRSGSNSISTHVDRTNAFRYEPP